MYFQTAFEGLLSIILLPAACLGFYCFYTDDFTGRALWLVLLIAFIVIFLFDAEIMLKSMLSIACYSNETRNRTSGSQKDLPLSGGVTVFTIETFLSKFRKSGGLSLDQQPLFVKYECFKEWSVKDKRPRAEVT